MLSSLIVFLYLAAILYVGIFLFRRGGPASRAEEYFLAGRSLGPFVFLASLFGTNMTAFAILGSSGHAFNNGIVTFGLMASSSALVIPLGLFFIGTRVWALGKRFGFMTPVQMFRDRWEMNHIGTAIFALQATLLVPYIVIGVMGGGTTMHAISGGFIPYWLGGAVVALVVMGYVFFGGMRGTAIVNTIQATMFVVFGSVALLVIGIAMDGFRDNVEAMLQSPALAPLLSRERVSPAYFFSYTFIPLSSIAFPHILIFCLTARKMAHFKKTVIAYPLCILAIWLPAVFLGVMANRMTDDPRIVQKIDARRTLATAGATLTAGERDQLRAHMAGDDVLVLMLDRFAPLWLAGLLGAGIMAAVMASDSQILALSTMFTEDVFAHYGGKGRFGEAVQVQTGRVFVVLLTLVAYGIALVSNENIFSVAVSYAFSGFSATVPLLVGALFWRRSTKWGAFAVTIWIVITVAALALFQNLVPAPSPGQTTVGLTLWGVDAVMRTPAGTSVFGFLPVVPIVLGSALLMTIVSLVTRPPSEATLRRYFPDRAIGG